MKSCVQLPLDSTWKTKLIWPRSTQQKSSSTVAALPANFTEDLEKERTSHCMAHTDWSTLTLLFQDDCGGLEVEDVSNPGTFIPTESSKNAVVINARDILQMWSNGTYHIMSDLYRELAGLTRPQEISDPLTIAWRCCLFPIVSMGRIE